MSKQEYTMASVQFKLGKKLIKFSVVHNLPNVGGLDFENALDAWLARTKDYSCESLVAYINSKETGFSAWTKDSYLKLIEEDVK